MQNSKSNSWSVETNNRITLHWADSQVCALPLGQKMELSAKLMGEQLIRYDVTVPEPLDLRAGDYIEWQGVRYSLFEEPDYKQTAGAYTYNLVFYAPYHILSHILHKDEGATIFPYVGGLREHLNALLTSIRAVDPAFELETEEENGTQLLEFSDTYCLDALTEICEAFEVEWEIRDKTILVRKRIGLDTSYRFAYGCGNGLYALEKKGITNNRVATRLYGRGGSENLPSHYRQEENPRPETLVFDGLFLEKNIPRYGVREEVATFDDIYPRLRDARLTEVVEPADLATATSWSVRVSLPFDLNDHLGEEDAQIQFTDGELTGEGFTVTHYDPTTGTLKFNVSESNGYKLPSATRRPRVGDSYVLLHVVMPQSYVDDAEAELKEATQKELDRRCEKRYAFTLDINPRYIRRHHIRLWPGDNVVVCETPTAAGSSIRITELTYPLYDPRRLSLVLSDTILYSSYAEKIEGDIQDVTKEVDTVYREARAFSRRAWRDAEELASKLESLRAELLLVGNHAGQFVVGATFTANSDNDPDRFTATEGKLQHAVYKGATDGIWRLGSARIVLESPEAHYLYARCSKTNDNGFFYATTERIEVEDLEGWYHFPVGVISSPFEGARVFNTTHGFTQIAGGSLTTGKIQDAARRLVIDLDNGTITGPVTFKNDDHFETIADGGLLLTSLIKTIADGIETGGLAANQDNILLWGGGTYEAALKSLAKIILRHDGSGQLAGGQITWNRDGQLAVNNGAKIGKFDIIDGGLDWETGGLTEGDIVLPYGHIRINPNAMGPVLEVRGSGLSTMKVEGDLLMQYGCIQNFGIKSSSISCDYTITEDGIVVCDNTEKITVTLPIDPFPGQMIYVRRNYSGAVDVKTADGSLIRKGNSEFTSHAIGGVGWTHLYIYHQEGYQRYRWLINLITH